MTPSEESSVAPGGFPPTQWSLILAAGDVSTGAARGALEQLCRLYWHPLYVFARRGGYAPADAQDLTQGFFEELIEAGLLTRADADRGRFRSFLLGAFKNFIRMERRRHSAAKRGGGQLPWSLGADVYEERFIREPATDETPDAAYDRQWATNLVSEGLRQLEAEHSRAGRNELFQQLRPFIQGDHDGLSYAEVAQVLGLSEGTIKVTVHRLRQRFRELLRFLVLQTLADPLQVEEELRHLIAALRR